MDVTIIFQEQHHILGVWLWNRFTKVFSAISCMFANLKKLNYRTFWKISYSFLQSLARLYSGVTYMWFLKK